MCLGLFQIINNNSPQFYYNRENELGLRSKRCALYMLPENAYDDLRCAILYSTDCESHVLYERLAQYTEQCPGTSSAVEGTHSVTEASTKSSIGTRLEKPAYSTRSAAKEHIRPTHLDSVPLMLVVIPILAPQLLLQNHHVRQR